ncbi:Snf7-domain-containing protein, partial [Pterulicium gracile]
AQPVASVSTFSGVSKSRLQALYSDFSRQKESNPTSYSSSIDWWRRTLYELVASGHCMPEDRLVLHVNAELLDSLSMPSIGKPLALGTVMTELQLTSTFFSQREFLAASSSIYSSGWSPTQILTYVLVKPLSWTLGRLGILGDSNTSTRDSRSCFGDYVTVGLVERAADEVLKILSHQTPDLAGSLYDFESFRETFASAVPTSKARGALSDVDARVLLKYLERDRGVVVREAEVIKFVVNAEYGEKQVTPIDRGVLELKAGLHRVKAQVEAAQAQISDCVQKAAGAVKLKQNEAAIGFLRLKKLHQDTLQKRLISQQNLQTMLLQIENAAGDIQIMQSFESSTAALRAILAHPSLKHDHIDETMSAMADANADAQEIHDAIHVVGDDAVDEAELADELAALERDTAQESAQAQAARLDNLNVPLKHPE